MDDFSHPLAKQIRLSECSRDTVLHWTLFSLQRMLLLPPRPTSPTSCCSTAGIKVGCFIHGNHISGNHYIANFRKYAYCRCRGHLSLEFWKHDFGWHPRPLEAREPGTDTHSGHSLKGRWSHGSPDKFENCKKWTRMRAETRQKVKTEGMCSACQVEKCTFHSVQTMLRNSPNTVFSLISV